VLDRPAREVPLEQQLHGVLGQRVEGRLDDEDEPFQERAGTALAARAQAFGAEL
jgi:hypothetical protein